MKKYAVMKARVEMTRKNYKKAGGYTEYMAASNDTEQERLAVCDTLEEAKNVLKGKKSSITPYPSNGLADIEEYYIDEYSFDGEAEEDADLYDYAENMGGCYVAPLDDDSRRFIKDIYAEEV